MRLEADSATLRLVVIATVAGLLAACGGSSDDDRATEADGETAEDTVPVTERPQAERRLYGHDVESGILLVLDPETLATEASWPVRLPGDKASGEYRLALWQGQVAIAHASGTIQVVDPTDGSTETAALSGAIDVFAVGDTLWAAGDQGITVYGDELAVEDTIDLPFVPNRFAAVGDDIWVMSKRTSDIAVIDPASHEVVGTVAGSELAEVVPESDEGDYFGGEFDDADGVVLVSGFADDLVVRIDVDDLEVLGTWPIGDGPGSVLADDDGLWVTVYSDGFVARVDPLTGELGVRASGIKPNADTVDGDGGLFVYGPDGPLVHFGSDGEELGRTELPGKVTSLISG